MPLGFGNIKEKSLQKIWKDMSHYSYFRGKCSCKMKDRKFRDEHRQIL
jgi:hypothetical protein